VLRLILKHTKYVKPRKQSGTIDLLHADILASTEGEVSSASAGIGGHGKPAIEEKMMGRLLGKLSGWLDLLLETRCSLCDRSTGRELCLDCQQQVQRCQLADPTTGWKTPLPVFAWGAYGGALKRSIATLKYKNQPQLARPLGDWLAQAWLNSAVVQPNASTQFRTKPLLVVPIPMHLTKLQQRGFNQAELIARSFCDRTRLPMQAQGLTRIRATEAQFSLSPDARTQNLSGAFLVSDRLKRDSTARAILLVDDIYTTGATANAAVQALSDHQIPVYGLVVVSQSVSQVMSKLEEKQHAGHG